MREHQVYEALRRYLDAAVVASVADPAEEAHRQAELAAAQLAYTNALEAFHLRLRTRSTADVESTRLATSDD